MKNLILLVVFLIWLNPDVFAQSGYPCQNPNLPVKTRVADLLSRMTLEEKIAQMSMARLKDLDMDDNGILAEESMGKHFGEAGLGFLKNSFIGAEDMAKSGEVADRYLRTKTRLGIPAVQIAECLHGYMVYGATIFPQAIAQGSTWNPGLIRKMSGIIAMEAAVTGVDQALSPLFDVARDPRYGRMEECYGEDPFHVAEMGKAFVIGMQGDPEITKNHIPDNHIICTAKHFVAYSTPVAGLNMGPCEIGPRSLRSLHLYPFEKAVKEANIYSVMPTYNEIDGIPIIAHRCLLRDVLRGEYGFEGYTISDYEAVRMLETRHKVSGNKAETALLALKAGVDLEAPQPYAYPELKRLMEEGKMGIELIDEAVTHILTVKFKAGLFDKPYTVPKNMSELIHTEEAVSLAREIAEESVVLLKNENNVLPLNLSAIKSIAVIGPNADKAQYGDYSVTKKKSSGVTLLDGIKGLVNEKVKVNYAPGCGITSLDTTGFKEAVEMASQSDLVVLAVGGTSFIYSDLKGEGNIPGDQPTCGEGYDRSELVPPGVQPQLIRAIYNTGKPVVLVLINGRAYDLRWENEHIPAILEAWYPGEQGGNAIARILFGEVNPSGRLPVSFPQSVGHAPVFYDYKPTGRGHQSRSGTPEKPGSSYVFSSTDPLFPFGFGLSYTKFEYSNLEISQNELSAADTIKISMKVKNTGKVVGKEVVQVYINDKVSSVTTPVKVLKGFKKVKIAPGKMGTVDFSIPCKELGLWDVNMDYVVEPGEFEVMIGASAEDIRLSGKVEIH
ncbi:MAG: hypothetical protein A2W90_17840 [Bacteroidetes bacterium GWF2_42_66]|nr:MAG: hypothetical protein A2W92_13110 [Bacteroidetes bacterium GWA2_42_15]OFX98116.1 MAG: hypothetical protein A2W89_09330 [Bacteroidetes bacterium GWE2_42_39]OFY42500.1 MAG: hypothetical protein A2W90_17840 [Bacteroidetes bacterium GWF2_42_66]HAZ03785.1 glycosyl hydrolase [Marinilabiliales bacterium]HBL74215.1 glycosyl hydrolase [Prolixibacteraceae bacterium]